MKTVVVTQRLNYMQAFQYDGDLQNSKGEFYVPDWAQVDYNLGTLYYNGPDLMLMLEPNKAHVVHVGDWVLNTPVGPVVITDDNFKMMYEIVEAPDKLTPKEQALEVMKIAIRLGLGVWVHIKMPDMEDEEQIFNPHVNVAHKIEYYNRAYNDNLELNANTKIRIVKVYTEASSTPEDEHGWRA